MQTKKTKSKQHTPKLKTANEGGTTANMIEIIPWHFNWATLEHILQKHKW